MAQIIVRNIEDDVKERIKALAKRHGRSVEEEDRKSTRLNSSHVSESRMASSA